MLKWIGCIGTVENCFATLLDLHRTAIRLGIYQRSGKVALVVGTLLNLINQPQALFGLLCLDYPAMQGLDMVKALLTYSVPFLVASYGALTATVQQRTDS
ncbi:nitrate/nitrite transporter NrtS [Methylomonas rosea]|uniref:Nitrate/nitrite transporter NrtS n=1 Tax=Methylomonas rosea TaxID=2952227 RepID=A0ABT1TNZ3_9GAMM|nr:nitrate/nitrite transporter NrtS [Methylomonas sp. WSC-7]MCQ8116499.1 nitrate/nitrite transporter NrtS [Methylomonas sp. WSC-7]